MRNPTCSATCRRLTVWDALYLRPHAGEYPWLRPICMELAQLTVTFLASFAVVNWPVDAAKEKLVVALATMVAPYQLAAVTGSRSVSEMVAFLWIDSTVVFGSFGLCIIADHIERAKRKSTGGVLRLFQQAVAADVPSEWRAKFPGGEGAAVSRRWQIISFNRSTTSLTLGCLAACALLHALSPEAERPLTLSVFMPVGTTSLGYMCILLALEMAQDQIIWALLMKESLLPTSWRVMTNTSREFLWSKRFPAVFSSSREMLAFVIPVVVGSSMNHCFIWGPADALFYENATF